MRTCIKCNKELPLGMFDDNWRHRTFVCKNCVLERQREYRKTYNAKESEMRRYLIKRVKLLEYELELTKAKLENQRD